VVLGRRDFVSVVRNAVAGVGFAPDIALVTFPIDMFLVESDIAPMERELDRFVDGLTRWQPGEARAQARELPTLRIEGSGYAEAFDAFNAMAIRRRWGDGLPLVPPTEERVRWILRGSDRPRETKLGKLMPRGGIVTLETLAVALAMAGGRPEYLPVLQAAIQAILDPALEHEGWQATSSSTFPVVVVNGAAARAIRLNAGFGLLGPDPQHPAGASIGRALRLLQQNVGGALPGTGTMAMFGAMRYTNAVFAEDEAGLPPGWEPFNVEHMGFERGVDSVAVNVASGADNIIRRGIGTETLDNEASASLYRIATYMKSHNANAIAAHRAGTPGILLLSRTVANQLAALGWTKRSIQEFLWEHSRIPLHELERSGLTAWMERRGAGQMHEDPWPITSKPENIAIVVAGGSHPTHAFWLQTSIAKCMTAARIELPRHWGELIAAANRELGFDQDHKV
jgi:hypothetical protein